MGALAVGATASDWVGAGTGDAAGVLAGTLAAGTVRGGCASFCHASIRKNVENVNSMNRMSRWVSMNEPGVGSVLAIWRSGGAIAALSRYALHEFKDLRACLRGGSA